jgi:membrane protein implicated in regulation of membrane protease activity
VSRRPNPWIAVPALVLGALAGALGWLVTDVSCRQPAVASGTASCAGWSTVIAIAAFATVAIGVTLILVLVYRSLGEWRDGAANRRQG